MAIIKCKMCGGDIELSPDKTFGTCEYCGSTMTFPKVDDEQRATAFNRGNHFRRIGEFDKALAVYERIVQEDDTDAEAHWCCALCRFGIEYVEDPASYEWLPTCHRASFDSFLEDVDYLAAVEHSDGITRRQYQKDAAKIAEVQRGILATSQNEEPFDVFICYKESDDTGSRTVDSTLAQDIYYQLTEQGRRVFFARITLEDKAGAQYEPYIFAALNSAKVMVAVGTRPEHFNAVWVKNEWSRFLALMKKDRSKLLIPCYRDMDPYDLPEQLSVLQSYDMGKIGFIQDLVRGIGKILSQQKETTSVAVAPAVVPAVPGVESLLKRGYAFLEDGEWARADEYFDKVLDLQLECGEAYAGKMCVEMKYHTLSSIAQDSETWLGTIGTANQNYQKVLRYGSPDLKNKVKGYITAANKATYDAACKMMEQANTVTDYLEAADEFERVKDYEDAVARREKCLRLEVECRERTKPILAERRRKLAAVAGGLAVGGPYTVGLRADGTVVAVVLRDDGTEVAVGDNKWGPCDVTGWTDIMAVAAGISHIVGLRADGTVVVAGSNGAGQCNTSGWTDIEAVAAAAGHTIGLRADGTVVAVGDNKWGPCDVTDWTDVVAVATGGSAFNGHTVGLRADGTVVTTDKDNKKEVSGWRNIVAVAAGGKHTVGLRADGTVVTTDKDNKKEVSGWRNIVAVAAGGRYIVGLQADGTVVTVAAGGELTVRLRDGAVVDLDSNRRRCMSGWRDIVAVAAGFAGYTVGLRADGTVVTTHGESDVSRWKLFNSIDTLEQERVEIKTCKEAEAEAKRQAEEAKRQAEEAEQQQRLQLLAEKHKKLALAERMLSAGRYHTVGLRADGTVVAVGNNKDGQCNVSGWTDIVAVATGECHTVGLRADGTVVAVGNNYNGQCSVSGWRDIVAVAAKDYDTVGLRADGTVVTTDKDTKKEVSGWRDIVAVAVGGLHTVGLRVDGTVVAVGNNEDGQCSVSDWADIVAVAAEYQKTVGLRADGTVVGLYGAIRWTNIVSVACGYFHTVGLRADGTVVADSINDDWCNVTNWTNIVAMAAGYEHTVGLRADGTLVAVGDNPEGQCDVSDWKLFNNIDTLEQERADFQVEAEARRRAEEEAKRQAEEAERQRKEAERQQKIAALNGEKKTLQTELSNLKGLFSGGKRRQIEARLAEIEAELNKL